MTGSARAGWVHQALVADSTLSNESRAASRWVMTSGWSPRRAASSQAWLSTTALPGVVKRDDGRDPDGDQHDHEGHATPQRDAPDTAAHGVTHARPGGDRHDEPGSGRHQRAGPGKREHVRQSEQGLGGDAHGHDAHDRLATALRRADRCDGNRRRTRRPPPPYRRRVRRLTPTRRPRPRSTDRRRPPSA